MKNVYELSRTEVLETFNTTKKGLSSKEANLRLEKDGLNQPKEGKKKSRVLKFLAQFKDIMIVILIVAAIISIAVAIKENQTSELVDGLIILGIVLINAIIGYLQENKAENALEKLKSLTKPDAKVLRDGELVKISSSHLVKGDVVILEAGDIVPADLRILESANLSCDESSLTGESNAVSKSAEFKCSSSAALADRKNMLYSGNVITNGRAVGVVVATGSETEIGKIANILATTEKEVTPLQKNIAVVGKIITIIILFIAIITFVCELVLRPEEPIIEAFLIAVALAVAAIPESLPAVITIIMSMGVTKLAKKKAIVKHLHAVETLGCCEVICSDKTGTLTQNVMTVKALYYDNQLTEAVNNTTNSTFLELIKCMTLCNDSVQNKSNFVGDPTETALCYFSQKCGFSKKQADDKFKRLDEISFDSKRKLMTTINKTDEGDMVFTKGAVDNILNICSNILIDGNVLPLTDELISQISMANNQMADKAHRVLGFAYKNKVGTKNDWESELTFIGMVGMIDPPRREVKSAVMKCNRAGMRAVMITGDHKNTAFAIAKEIGIASSISEVMLGVELDKLSDDEFVERLKTTSVFARVSPENKVRIVQTFKKLGKVVAMTGDGVNDAPSLKTASIGVGMGITGTDVTKEVADIIVTDDNFATIVLAVEEGRKIYKNIQKTIKFLFSANLAEVLSIFIATLAFPQFIFLLPVQILFVNLITDSLPAIAMGFEPAEKDLMNETPRNSKKTLLSDGIGVSIVVNGIFQAIIILSSYLIGLKIFNDDKIASTMAFFTLNFVQLFYIFSVRIEGYLFSNNPFKNMWQVGAFFVGVLFLVIIAFTPLHNVISLVSLNYSSWLIILGLSLLILPFSELLKFIIKRIEKKKNI
mgnify:CR=1 FL=1